jgi:hypothetical protein
LHDSRKRLLRNALADAGVVRTALSRWAGDGHV